MLVFFLIKLQFSEPFLNCLHTDILNKYSEFKIVACID